MKFDRQATSLQNRSLGYARLKLPQAGNHTMLRISRLTSFEERFGLLIS